MTAASQSQITATIAGIPTGVWDSRAGGETTAEVGKRRPGGMAPETARRGRGTTGDVTISRGYELGRDNVLERRLRPLVGLADGSVNEQLLDLYGAPVPNSPPTTWSGVLTGVNVSDSDSDSDEDRTIELTFVITSVA